MNQLLKKHPNEIETILSRYPQDKKRAAVMPLLHLVQQDAGFVSRDAMGEIAEITDLDITEVASIVGFYTLFHDEEGGRIRVQVCTDIACELRGAREYLLELCREMGIKPGETTADGLVTIEEVKCLAACDRAPIFQSQIGDEIEYHENQSVHKTLDWLRSMMASMSVPKAYLKPGSDTGGGSHD